MAPLVTLPLDLDIAEVFHHFGNSDSNGFFDWLSLLVSLALE